MSSLVAGSAVTACPAIAVGTTLYVFDHNRRKWDAERRIIYREHFEPRVVVGETRQSWLIGEGWRQSKVNKKTMLIANPPMGFLRAYTAAGMEEDVWAHDNRYRIVRAVESADVATLRAVDAILTSRRA